MPDDVEHPHLRGHSYVPASPSATRKVCVACFDVTETNPNIIRRNDEEAFAKVSKDIQFAVRLLHDSITSSVKFAFVRSAHHELMKSLRKPIN